MRFTVTIEVGEGDYADELVRETLTKWVEDKNGLVFEPAGTDGSNHPEWRLEGDLAQITAVLAAWNGLNPSDALMMIEVFSRVTEVFDPDFTPAQD